MNALTGSCLTGLDVRKNSDKSSQLALKDEAKLMEKMQKAADSVSLSEVELRTLITDIKIVNKAKRTCINMNRNNRNYFNTQILLVY